MTDTTAQPVATQPVATVPSVADIPPDPNADSGVATGSPDNVTSMSLTDQSIHRCGDKLAAMYVGGNKSSKYKTKPLPEMMPAYLYRATSSLGQTPMALLRWAVDNFLARVFVEHGANNLMVDADWWGNAPAHLRYETALELARLRPEWRPYALATWTIMAQSSKVKGSPDITAKLNPYAVLLNTDNAAFMDKMHDDAVCALRYDYDPSPYQMYGRGVHAPSRDPVDEWVNSKRDPAYAPPVDCGASLLDAVKAGIRLYRGPGARKAGQDHADMMRPTSCALTPESALVDNNLHNQTDAGVVMGQADDTTLYLNTTPAWQALFADPMYGGFVSVLFQPPTDEATAAVSYTDDYHEQVTRALSRLPRWSMLYGDSGDASDKAEHPLNVWELDPDPKPLNAAASAVAQTIQAIGLFGPTMPPSDLVDGVAVTRAEVSKVDPLLVAPIEGVSSMEWWYAYARLLNAQPLADLTEQLGKTKKPMPAHATVIKALDNAETQQAWLNKQTDPAYRADVSEVLGEIEFKLMVLRQVQMRQAEQAIDSNIALTLRGLANGGGPAHVLAELDTVLRNAQRAAGATD